jgi:large subunit ribosomal protein L18e
MKSKTTNPNLQKLISSLRKTKKDIWKRVASDLQQSRRIRRTVNLSRISRYTKDGETAVIPGKVLGDGALGKKLDIAAFQFSQSAVEKIKAAGGTTLTIQELLQKNPDAKGVRIIG